MLRLFRVKRWKARGDAPPGDLGHPATHSGMEPADDLRPGDRTGRIEMPPTNGIRHTPL